MKETAREQSPTTRVWLPFLDAFLSSGIAPSDAEPQLLRQIRITNVMNVALCVLAIPFVALNWSVGRIFISFALCVATLLCVGNILFLRRSRAPALAAHIAILAAYAMLVLGNLSSRNLSDPSFGWLYIVALAAMLTTGLRGGWYWIAVFLLTTLGFWAFSPGPELNPTLLAPASSIQSLVHRITGILAVAVLTTIAVFFQRQTETSLEAEIVTRKQAEQGAREADRIKGEFLANVSHEIRTPMNGVVGMIDLLTKADLDPSHHRLVEAIDTSAETLLVLVDDLLDFSKMEAGKLSLYIMDFKLRDLLEKAVALLAPKAAERGIDLELSIAEELPDKLYGDAQRLRQVLLNLISNAIRFTSRGKVTVSVEQIDRSETEVSALFSVHDTGVGIPTEHQASIFSPFIQADATSARKFGGTGLGLAIAKSLVELMGGEIGLRSKAREGSTFWFRLPLWQARQGVPKGLVVTTRAKSPKTNTVTIERRETLKILVVDDDDINRLVAESQLEDLGFAAEAVAAGQEALDRFAGNCYDAILMDCQMPDLDGYETTRRIRQLETSQHHTVIIAVTAHAMKGERERCLAAGMDDYVSKPLRGGDLAMKLERWLPVDQERPLPDLEAQPVDANDKFETHDQVPRNLQPPLDVEQLGQKTGKDLVAQMHALFLAEGSTRIETMHTALSQADTDLLAKTAHSLAGSAIYLGASELSELCRTLETLAEDGDLNRCQTHLQLLEEEHRKVTKEISRSQSS